MGGAAAVDTGPTPSETPTVRDSAAVDTGPAHSETPKARKTQLRIPWGWLNDARSLARHGYFEPGEGICAELESHGYDYIRPIMMDNHEIYLIAGSRDADEGESYFVWNPITGTILKIRNNNLAEVMETMGRSILALEVDDLDEKGKQGDSHGGAAGG